MADTATLETTGTVSGGVKTLLRLEGLTLLAGMTLVYGFWGGPWWLYAVLFFAPDLSFVAYLAGPKIGACVYNAMHTTIVPMAVLTAGFGFAPYLLWFALIWLAHIGFDRALGYGLKYSAGFGFTHLGRIGRGAGGRFEVGPDATLQMSSPVLDRAIQYSREPLFRRSRGVLDAPLSRGMTMRNNYLNGGSLPGGTVCSAIASTIATIT